MNWSHIISVKVQVVRFSFSFSGRYLLSVIKFFLNGHKVLDVINVCCCCCLILSSRLAFLVMADLVNLIRHFLLHWSICVAGNIFVHTPIFWKKYLYILGGLCSSFGGHLGQKCEWAGSEFYVQSHITEASCSAKVPVYVLCFFTPKMIKQIRQFGNSIILLQFEILIPSYLVPEIINWIIIPEIFMLKFLCLKFNYLIS